MVYIPFGEVFVEERNGSWTSPYLFNAKELDEETGLYYYGARYLNPSIALWLSTDPLQGKYPGMSPYNYCAGNPVKLVDPDGKKAINGYEYKYSNKANSEELSDETDYITGYQIIKMGGYEKDKAYHYLGHGARTRKDANTFVYAIDYKGKPIDPIQESEKLHSLVFEEKINDNPEYTCVVFHSCNSGESLGSPAVAYSIAYPDEYVVAPNNEVTFGIGCDSECNIVAGFEYVAGADGKWEIFKGGEVIGTLGGHEKPSYDNIVKEIKTHEQEIEGYQR